MTRSLLQLGLERLRKAALQLPTVRHWLTTLALLLAFAAVALPLGLAGNLFQWSTSLSPATLTLLAARALITPALLEETLFRVLANPHPSERADSRLVSASALFSLSVYVLVHPLVALAIPDLRATFLTPEFLIIVALLGSVCLLAYRLSGSLWPPVTLHWLTVTLWLVLGGQGPLPPLS